MSLLVETVDEKEKVLIISKSHFSFIPILKKELIDRGCEVFFSSQAPKALSQFTHCFFINQEIKSKISARNNVLIFINKQRWAEEIRKKNYPSQKIININGNLLNQDHIDRILWFTFAASNEKYLSFSASSTPKNNTIPQFSSFHVRLLLFFTPKKIVLSILGIIIMIHLLFLPFLLISYFYTYQSYRYLTNESYRESRNNIQKGKIWFYLSKNLYSLVKPTYALFSISPHSDQLLDFNDRSLAIFTDGISVIESTQSIAKDFMKKDKTTNEISYLILKFENLKQKLGNIENNLLALQSKIPFQFIKDRLIKTKIAGFLDEVSKIRKILRYSDNIFAKDAEKKYLLLFANNMELRPGGGFIGSFGIITIKNYTLADLKIYDVYDADGQLTAHIEPPLAIKKYLNMPHLFLRDSNYNPDFMENYSLAKMFLEKEMNFNDFSGAATITTSAIESLLDAFGEIYLPDFKETINKRNFYLKTQIHVENNFFPGSTQKKTYLSSLTKQILLNLDNASIKKMALSIKKSLDEKQITLAMDDLNIQPLIDSLYWSGRIIQPSCPNSINNCMVDYLFPFDTNVGPNKVNYYVKRKMSQSIKIDSNGGIKNTFTIQIKNESSTTQFPGGIYRNYFQIYLPPNSILKQITNNGTLIENPETASKQYLSVGFFVEIEPQKEANIKINYDLPAVIKSGKAVYQLIVQKQIGSSNNDFSLELQLAKNISISNQNFSPLVNENKIIYNTVLSADKIFYIELIKN